MILRLLLISLVFPLCAYVEYLEVCHRASVDDEVFAHFKQHQDYTEVLEHVPEWVGAAYLNYVVKEYPDLVNRFDRFRQNDLFGDPLCYSYGSYGRFSPTTLRYIKVAGDLQARFGSLTNMHVLEIGGGYGGQCKILSDLGGFASYTIVDLPDVLGLAQKYLSQLSIENVFFVNSNTISDLDKSYDVLISNYAFLEFGRPIQEQYCKVILSAKSGYITGNFPPHEHYISQQELVDLAMRAGIAIQIEEEHPSSGANNLILSWKSSL